MTRNQHFNLYIASCCTDGGIYQYNLFDNGKVEFVNKTPLDRPMYAAISNNKMAVVLREAFESSKNSGIVTFDIAHDGTLVNQSQIQSTYGEVACHVMMDNDDIYAVNYISGSVIKLPDTLIMHSGKSVNLPRQNSPHTHFVCLTPDKKYICVSDLGLDTIYVYDKNLNFHSKASVPSGHGTRHLVFSSDGKYMFSANELMSTVSAFSYSDGKLKYIDTCSALPKEFEGISTIAAIRIHNGYIYVSNRGADSISELRFENESLRFVNVISCGGNSPRDFDFVGNFLVCANENSDNAAFFKIQNENLVKCETQISIKSPLCICHTKN